MKYLKRFKNWIIFTVLGVGVAMAAGQVLPDTPSIAKEKMAMAYEQSSIKAKYKMENASFIMEAVDKNAIQIEVGDKTKQEFSPEANIRKWDNEVSMKIKPKTNSKSKKKEFIIDGEKIKYKEDKKEFHFYEIENGYEVEVILLEKPETNIVEMEIETRGLDFFYQPELTQKEKDDGAFRPENVIGSYAVYHESKQGDYSKMGKKNYRAGKAFHIYRPLIIDDAGTEVWGKLNITDNLLTVEIPQEFLDTASYPVIVDPTFGCDPLNPGGSNTNYSSGYYGSQFTGAVGTTDSISAYAYRQNSNNHYVAIYLHSNSSKVDESGAVLGSGASEWQDYSLNSQDISAVDYVLVLTGFGRDTYLFYDAGDTNQGHYNTSDNSFPATASFSHNSNKYSIYCTYTAGGGEEEAPKKQDVIWF